MVMENRQVKSVRFWVYWNDSYARLHLKKGKPLYMYQSGPTDEGWSSICVRYELLADAVISEVFEDGVDCDGRLSTMTTYTCAIDKLTERPGGSDPTILRPDWKMLDQGQRDYSAEAMGY